MSTDKIEQIKNDFEDFKKINSNFEKCFIGVFLASPGDMSKIVTEREIFKYLMGFDFFIGKGSISHNKAYAKVIRMTLNSLQARGIVYKCAPYTWSYLPAILSIETD